MVGTHYAKPVPHAKLGPIARMLNHSHTQVKAALRAVVADPMAVQMEAPTDGSKGFASQAVVQPASASGAACSLSCTGRMTHHDTTDSTCSSEMRDGEVGSDGGAEALMAVAAS